MAKTIKKKAKKVSVKVEVAKNMFITLTGYLHKKGKQLILKDQYNAVLIKNIKRKDILK
jgi:hypothetical protein